MLAAEHAGERRVAGAEALPEGDDVGLERQLVGGEPRSRPAGAGDDLVEADEEAVALAALGEPFPEAGGRRVGRQRGRAHGLAEEGGDRLRPRLLDDTIELRQRFLAGLVETPRARRDVKGLCEVRLVGTLEPGPARERERAQGRAVVRLRGRDDTPALRVAPLDVVAPRQPKRCLVRLGAARDEANPRHPRRGYLEQPARERLLRLVREVVVVDVREALCLRGGRIDDVAAAVPEAGDHRPASAGVEDPASVDPVEPDPFAALDARVGEVELARQDARLVGTDLGGKTGGRHLRLAP